MRLTALCHDVGHGVMSHVSEKALTENFAEVETIEFEFADAVNEAEKPRLSEIAAYYIIGSPTFAELVDLAQTVTHDHTLPQKPTTLMQRAVVGATIRDDIPLLQETISGPFDADKLDYMTRDAHMTGVPIVTDINRLVRKVRAITLPAERLPEEVGRAVEAGHAYYVLTGISLSGGRTLDELMIGRALLYDKLYRHQKVRAAEVMVAAIFQQLAPHAPDGPAMVAYALDDADLFDLDDGALARLGINDPAALGPALEIARDLASRLRDRRLFVRAYAFAQNMPLDPYRSEVQHWRGLEQLRRAARSSSERGQLIDRIATELGIVLAGLGMDALIDELPGNDVRPFLWIDPPHAPEQGSDIPRAYLIGDDGEWIRFRDDYAETLGWSTAYPLTRDLGFLFTTPELAPYAFIATEKVLRHDFQVKTPKSMLPYARRTDGEVRPLKHVLAAGGYYDSSAYDLRPLPERLRRADVGKRLRDIVDALRGYEGPVREGHAGKQASLINEDRAMNWLRQFESDELTDAALQVLANVRMVGRRSIASTLRNFLQHHEDLHGGALCPLGEPKDSSAILTYYSEDVAPEFGLVVQSLREALTTDKPVILVDDFIGSGRQSISLFEHLLGVERTVELNEVREQALPENLQEALRTRSVAVVFAAGTTEGAQRLQVRLAELGVNAEVHVGLLELPTVRDERIFASPRQQAAFLERCAYVGKQLLINEEVGHSAKWAEDKGLGYGDSGYLVIFPYNTPTQTLTALWAGGDVDGVPWEPLFPRRPKR